MRGLHKRMGDVWIPDRALLKRELMDCLTLLEEDWTFYSSAGDVGGKSSTALTASMLLAGWFAALRGEEIVRIDVGQMRKHWLESTTHEEAPHTPLMLSGRFKREVGEKVFCQPLTMESKSGVKIGQWLVLENFGSACGAEGHVRANVSGHGKGRGGDVQTGNNS